MEEYTIREINKYCDRYGDKLIELMDWCEVHCLPDVPEEKAIIFLEKLRGGAQNKASFLLFKFILTEERTIL